ncbi:MAG: hypothetical protein AAGA67_11040 [Cyanobacteria bacterium P01_F01_bin.153]
MWRNRLVLFCLMAGLLGACGTESSSTNTTQTPKQATGQTAATSSSNANSAALPAGDYPVQQVSYDDSNGQYSLMLLNTPQGTSPVFRTDALQMARLPEEDAQAGKASYFRVAGGDRVLYLSPDFQIQYVPSTAQTQVDPNTGRERIVYVRQQPTYWSPFATGVLTGAIASDLLTPRYYVPPVYVVGQPLVGYGGYGNTYDRAVSSYRTRYNEPPRATRTQQFRTTGSINRTRNSTTGNTTTTRTTTTNRQSSPTGTAGTTTNRTTTTTTTRKQPTNTNRSTGSGVGSSTLRNSSGTSTSRPRRRSGGSSFGSSSGRRSRPSGGFRRRRR